MFTERRSRGTLGVLLAALLVAGTACGERAADAENDGALGADPPDTAELRDEAQQTWAPGPPTARPPAASTSPGPSADALPEELRDDAAASQEVDISELGFDFGSPDAPIRVIEFSDFGCGYCRQFHLETYPTLHEEYVETGKVHWKYVPYILGMFGPNAVDATVAGECAGEQGGFAAMRDRLFAQQGEWKGADDPRARFRSYAREAGLDMDRYASCMEENRPQARIVASSQLGRQLGVRGTPTFYIPGVTVLPGALPVGMFRMVLDEVLAALEATEGGGGGEE